ncbi:PIG-L family deacetylase [Pontibacillus yanchengensis]|uniref:PIG-L family deacetylase n=2 Tax=Pontibacillus yanchengensis TaxID=462910 RepID=A0ACC7VG37_9BACI|nr:PIG-L deacetylase family protein [Pontibacillus yanchengensis]MYL35602.1 PIG-L family deacetylase [Pontibacillus yanchengensis]MYL53662.1 PIG-L family deacetylase [Pontibacillus yanchengensis]
MTKSVLVIAAHPDDELLGVAGTLKKLIKEGHTVISTIVAKGRKEEEHKMKQKMKQANKEIGIKEVKFLEYENLKLEQLPLHTLTKEIELLINLYQPQIIFTHHYGDVNRDHQKVFEAVLTAVRPIPGQSPIDLITFETVSSSEWNIQTNDKTFKPNYFVNVTDYMDDKIKALKSYEVEMRNFPHPRSYDGVRYLARVRGMTVGVPYAEAFELIRRVWL